MIIEAIFMAGLAKYFWDQNRSTIVVGVLSALFASKGPQYQCSKAERTASKTLILTYIHNDSEYQLHLPVRGRPLKWKTCMAYSDNGEIEDVSDFIRPIAGPFGDFFGLKLAPGQIVRGAQQLRFYGEKDNLVLEII